MTAEARPPHSPYRQETGAPRPRRGGRLPLLLALLVTASPAAWAVPDAAVGPSRLKEVDHEVAARGRAVEIDSSSAEVRVVRSPDDFVRVHATLEYWSNSDPWMQAVERSFDVALDEGASAIEIRPTTIEELDDRGFLERLLGRHQVSWELALQVQVPAGTRLAVDNSYGEVVVEGIGGEVEINNTSGDVSLSGARSARIENRYGNVSVAGVETRLEANVTSGELAVERVGGAAALTSRYGGASVNDIGGELVLDVSSGAAEVSDVGRATVRVAYGDATVRDVTGDLGLDVGSGKVTVAGVTGNATVEVRYGSFQVSDVGGWLKLRGSSAGGRIGTVGDQLDLTTSYEDVHVERVGGIARIENTSGGVTLLGAGADASVSLSYAAARVQGVRGSLRVNGQSSAVSVRDVDGAVEVQTSYEGVTVEEVRGPVSVRNQSGRVTVFGLAGAALTASHWVATSYADVDFTWPASAPVPAFRLESSYGNAASDFPGRLDERSSRQVLEGQGTAGEAGPKITLTAQSGSVRLRKR